MEVNDKKDKMKVRGTMTYHTNGDAEFSAQKDLDQGTVLWFVISV